MYLIVRVDDPKCKCILLLSAWESAPRLLQTFDSTSSFHMAPITFVLILDDYPSKYRLAFFELIGRSNSTLRRSFQTIPHESHKFTLEQEQQTMQAKLLSLSLQEC